MYEFIATLAGIGFVLIIASIGLWKTGQLRKLFDKFPQIDRKVEALATFYDVSYVDLSKKVAELQKQLEELLKRLPK